MNLYPFNECVAKAQTYIRDGAKVYQQFNCAHCGMKQTMPDANVFYKLGKCEECDKVTDIEKNGMNYMLHFGIDPHDRS
jgi:transcription elongation factor Elf1